MAQTERASRPRVDLHQGLVDNPAPVERGIPFWMVIERRQDHDRLFHLEWRSYVAHDLPTVDFAPRHRDDHFDHVGFGALEQDDAQLPVDRHDLTGVHGAHHFFRWFEQADIGEAQKLTRNQGSAAREDDLAGSDDLVPRERCERMEQGGDGQRGHVWLMLRAATHMNLYDRPMEAA